MHRLPGGGVTRSELEYIDAWRALGEPFFKALGWRLYAYDPGLSFHTGSGTEDVCVELALAFKELWEK